MKLAWLVPAVLCACFTSTGGPPIAVDLEVFADPSPALTAYRDGDGPWRVLPAAGSDAHYTLTVTHDYEFLVVCAQGSQFDAELYGATEADGTSQSATCTAPGPSGTPPTQWALTGVMAQPGTVDSDDCAVSGTTANWPFTVQAPTGSNDVVAWTTTAVMIERNLTISGPLSLGTLDVATSGAPLQQATLAVSNTDASYVGASLIWSTANGDAVWSGSGMQLALPPTSLLEPEDNETIFIDDSSSDGVTYRSTTESFSGTPATLSLPLLDPFASPSLATSTPAITASWNVAPAQAQQLALSVIAASASAAQMTDITVTPSWLAASDANQLTYDISPAPNGYAQAWQVSPANAGEVDLDAYTYDATTQVYSYADYATDLNVTSRSLASRREQRAAPRSVAALREWVRNASR